MPTPTAPLLAPYTNPLSPTTPRGALTLLTSVLGATGNWVVVRVLCDALAGEGMGVGMRMGSEGGMSMGGDRKVVVVLVSFLRGWEFWRGEGRRVGLDLNRLSNQGSFVFIDGLSELFSTPQQTPAPAPAPTAPSSSAIPSRTPLRPQPARGTGPLPIRPAATTTTTTTTSTSNQPKPASQRKLHWSSKAGLDALEQAISSAIDDVTGSTASDERPVENEVLLVLDQPDLLLAATGPGMGVGAVEMGEWVMGLRERVHSTLVTLSADSPLIHIASDTNEVQQQPTPLETEHAALVVGMAHQARTVMQLRGLDTGVARDVSGVLRISKGGGWAEMRGKGDGQTEGEVEEKEVLYFVQGDGAVRVFGRGE
ncbi:hypothetical protein FQN52_000778 [Onygenales sp. PD_12]|nr:hypothetical protein FQN52_000778 [Onygenales sp. PD_12]